MRRTWLRMSWCLVLLILPLNTRAEEPRGNLYVSIYGGMSVPQAFGEVSTASGGTSFSDLTLKNSPMVGVKIGVTPPSWLTWIGWEAEFFYSNPHMKQQTVTATGILNGPVSVAGAHVRAQVLAFNMVLRVPTQTVQPYLGVGPAIVWGRASGPDTGTGSDTSVGLNTLAGLQVRAVNLTRDLGLALFGEYKYTVTSLEFPALHGNYRAHGLVAGASLLF